MEKYKRGSAEYEMRLSDEKIMKNAAENKKAAENEKWEAVKETLRIFIRTNAIDSTNDVEIDCVIDILRKNYQLPIVK